jgi:hypothetical protein
MAETGRHWWWVNLASQVAMTASAPARFSSAKARAALVGSWAWARTSCCAAWFHSLAPVAFQKRAVSVWWGVRVVLAASPTALTSWKSRA